MAGYKCNTTFSYGILTVFSLRIQVGREALNQIWAQL